MARIALGIILSIFGLRCIARCQEQPLANWNWDFSVWTAAATGEERTNSLTEAQILSAGMFVGKALKKSAGNSWRSGSIEYGFSVAPLFSQFGARKIHGIAFDPLILRWISNHSVGHATPYVELGGGGLHTGSNLPAGNTSSFNFTAKMGGGLCLPIDRGHLFDAGVLWSHISNANLGTQNPEFNGIEIRFAFHWLR